MKQKNISRKHVLLEYIFVSAFEESTMLFYGLLSVAEFTYSHSSPAWTSCHVIFLEVTYYCYTVSCYLGSSTVYLNDII